MKINKLKSLIFNSPIGFIGGLFGAVGGQGLKWVRRLGIPGLLVALAYYKLHNLWVFTILFMIIPFYLGYGIPDFNDSGSFLGRFWFKINYQRADELTRGTIGLLFVLSLLSIPLIKHNWIIYISCSLGIIATMALLSWRGFGIIKMFGKELLIVNVLSYGLVTLFASFIIYY
ncbi:MAG: hypothetical protein V1901_03905 [Patescibacteria group bacterium]